MSSFSLTFNLVTFEQPRHRSLSCHEKNPRPFQPCKYLRVYIKSYIQCWCTALCPQNIQTPIGNYFYSVLRPRHCQPARDTHSCLYESCTTQKQERAPTSRPFIHACISVIIDNDNKRMHASARCLSLSHLRTSQSQSHARR